MAVAMETTAAWRRGEVLDVTKKRKWAAVSWGADAQQLMHMMVGQLQQSSSVAPDHQVGRPELSTLDLLGKPDPCSSNSAQLPVEYCSSASPALCLSNFLELGDPEAPLPSGWEKCLDLKTGKVYYVSQASGVSTFNDPRKHRSVEVQDDVELAVSSPRAAAHEFLGSKRSETLRQAENCTTTAVRGASSSSSSGRTSPSARAMIGGSGGRKGSHQLLTSSFSTGKQLWNLHLDDQQVEEEGSVLELDLNLAAGGSSSPSSSRPTSDHHHHHHQQQQQQQAVCTMEMIQNALKRTAEIKAMRDPPPPLPPAQVLHHQRLAQQHQQQPKPASGSSSFSSLTSTRSDPTDSNLAPSPSTSSSSSTSSRSRQARQSVRACTEGGGISSSDALVMGACTRCLMYVMLKKVDPRCPRCESEVPVDFSTGPAAACKRQRVVL